MKDLDVIKKDIIKILKAYLTKDYVFELDNNVEELVEITTKYGFGAIVGYTLHNNETYKDNHSFDSLLFYCAVRSEKQKQVRDKIKELLASKSINFVFTKGCTVSKYYEEEYLRYSNDIDVIVNNDDRKIAANYLKDNGFLIARELGYTTELFFDEIKIDFQSVFVNDEIEKEIFRCDNNKIDYEYTKEYEYLNIVAHAAKHLKNNFINFRYLFDMFHIYKLIDNKDFINEKLEEWKLKDFNDATIRLLNSLEKGDLSNSIDEEYFDFLINLANSDGAENKVLVSRRNEESGIKYLKNRMFPSYDIMCGQYPKLLNRKAMLPLYYVKRFVDRINQNMFQRAVNEVKSSINVDKNDIKKIKELFKAIGLDE